MIQITDRKNILAIEIILSVVLVANGKVEAKPCKATNEPIHVHKDALVFRVSVSHIIKQINDCSLLEICIGIISDNMMDYLKRQYLSLFPNLNKQYLFFVISVYIFKCKYKHLCVIKFPEHKSNGYGNFEQGISL